MKKDENKTGVSLFSQSEFLIDNDPLEEIFALNLGDFLSEHLISEELAHKIGEHTQKDKKEGLKNQLRELISIYSLSNTLCVLNFETEKDYAIITSIAKSIAQMTDTEICNIYLAKEYAKGISNCEMQLVLAGTSAEHQVPGLNVDSESVVAKTYLSKETQKDEFSITISIHSASQNIGVIELKNSALQDEFIELVESIANLFATSITLQSQIDETYRLLNNENTEITDLQHMRAELTALIGDLCDYQQVFVQNLANAVDTKGGYKVSHSKNTAELASLSLESQSAQLEQQVRLSIEKQLENDVFNDTVVRKKYKCIVDCLEQNNMVGIKQISIWASHCSEQATLSWRFSFLLRIFK